MQHKVENLFEDQPQHRLQALNEGHQFGLCIGLK